MEQIRGTVDIPIKENLRRELCIVSPKGGSLQRIDATIYQDIIRPHRLHYSQQLKSTVYADCYGRV